MEVLMLQVGIEIMDDDHELRINIGRFFLSCLEFWGIVHQRCRIPYLLLELGRDYLGFCLGMMIGNICISQYETLVIFVRFE